MDLELTDEQEALRDTVRRCLADRAPITPYVRAHVEGRPWRPDDAWETLAGVGATGLLVPPDLGGLGLGMTDAVVVAEEAGRGLYPGPWLPVAVGAVRALLAAPDRRAATPLVESIAAGTLVAVAVPRPLAGRPGAPTLTGGAVRGVAHGVVGAPDADVLLVVADTGDGTALAAVRADGPGVVVGRDDSMERSRSIGTVQLEGAPADVLGALAEPDAVGVTESLVVAMAADALGAAQAVSELAVEYAKQRHQFGVPIGSFQAVQHLCVDMLETVELARGGVLHAAWAIDAADPERHRAVLRLKAFADRLATVADIAIQVFGGIGFTWEHDSHLYLKRLLAWSAYLGAPGWYRRELGRTLVSARSTG